MLIEVAVRVQSIVAEELIRGTVEVARAGAGDHVDLSAGTPAIFRPISAALYLEFLDGIYTGRVQQAEVSSAIHVVGAVERPIILRKSVAVYREINLIGAAAGGLNANVKRVA